MKLLFIRILLLTTALGFTSAVFAQSTDYLAQWKTDGAGWTDSASSWVEVSSASFPESSAFYFHDTATVNGTDRLWHSVSNLYPETGTIKWAFSIVCNAKNSSVNNFKIMLFANDTVPNDNGYSAFAIGTGLKTGIYSQLCLLKYTGTDVDILAATDIMFDNTKNIKDLEISRTAAGKWLINGVEVYQEPEPRMYIADYIAIEYKHTATGNLAFNILPKTFSYEYTGNTISAKMYGAEIIDSNVVSINVDGRLSKESACKTENYSLNGAKPDSIHFTGNNIVLFFDTKVFNSSELTLSAKNITQADGQPMANYEQVLYMPMFGDIVINEIMCDVSPAPANLPAVKYIELYNPSKVDFSLKNCLFFAGDYQYAIPEIQIAAGEYMLICRSDSLDSYAKTVKKFDDSKLTIKNKKLSLINQAGYIVDSLTYTLEMYNDKVKSQGGYSLERIDPRNLYMVEGNWTASLDIAGGTPGRVNSTLSTVKDNQPPNVIATSVVDNNTIKIVFSKNILADASKLLLNGNASTECSVSLNTVTAKFSEPLKEGDNTLKISPLPDYVGNLSADTSITFSYYRLKLLNVYAASNYQLCFEFNNDLNLSDLSVFYSNNEVNATIHTEGNTAFVGFAKTFAQDSQITASAVRIRDIYGNVIDSVANTLVYHNTGRFDILITEVMFYPLSGEKRFLEIYNNSQYPIPINQYSIVFYDNKGERKQSVINTDCLLQPEQYALITPDTATIQQRYTCGGVMIQHPKLSAFDNTRGSIVLLNTFGAVVDSMVYDRTESNTLEINVQGVSLERIGFNPNSTDLAAWKFATAAADYATPGLPNSHVEPTPATVLSNSVTIINELFTPDGDGYNDEVEILVSSSCDDTAADVSIYDANGVHRCTLANRTNIGTSASFYWNGKSDSGDFCKSGIYVIYIKTISPNGKTSVYKKVCVLSRK